MNNKAIAILAALGVITMAILAYIIHEAEAAQYKARYGDTITVRIDGKDFNKSECMVMDKAPNGEPIYHVGPCQ